MLPRALYQRNLVLSAGQIVPGYLTERDHVWLRALLDEYVCHQGEKQKELRQRLQEPLSVRAPKFKLRLAQHVLDRTCHKPHAACVPPREARQVVFHLAAEHAAMPRDSLMQQAAASLQVSPTQLEGSLFADLAGERLLGELPPGMGPAQLADQCNLALVGALLSRAREVHIVARGHTRALVRQARLAGLICVIEKAQARTRSILSAPASLDALGSNAEQGAVLHISGPYALFRQTRLYGRALAALLPRVAWCHEYELTAECVLSERAPPACLVVKSGDPIPAGKELKRFDSRVEEQFERSFRKAAPDWEIIREPEPLSVGSRLIFPDFELRHRHRPEQRWYLEIAGFWTEEYLKNKLEQLRAAKLGHFILCVDSKLCCSQGDVPASATVIRYKRRIDPKSVLEAIESRSGGATQSRLSG